MRQQSGRLGAFVGLWPSLCLLQPPSATAPACWPISTAKLETPERIIDGPRLPTRCSPKSLGKGEPVESSMEAIELGGLDFPQPLANGMRGYEGHGLKYGPWGA